MLAILVYFFYLLCGEKLFYIFDKVIGKWCDYAESGFKIP